MRQVPTWDLVVLVGYLAAVIAWGIWKGRGGRTGREYFLGGRNLPWLAVLLSVVATETSTLTFLSIPGVAYFGTLAFLQLSLGYLVGRTVVAVLLLPRYFSGNLTTAYHLLEASFGLGARRFTSAVFMVTRLLADSVRLFATAIPLALLTGWPYTVSILVIGVATLAYTYVGGIRAVVWVDVVQMVLYIVGGVAGLLLIEGLVPGGWTDLFRTAAASGKLEVVDLSFDPGTAYTLWAGLLGGAFLSMASHGTDQLIVQRLLTCRDLGAARRALIGSGVAVAAQFLLFLLLGAALWVFYQGQAFDRPDEVFARFIVDEIPTGLAGLLIAGVFAAAMSSLSSSINSLSSAVAYDFFAPAARLDRDDARTYRIGRAATVVWTAALVGGAVVFIPLSRESAAVEVALGVSSLVYGGLLGAFALALLVGRGGTVSAITAMASGIAAVTGIWVWARTAVAWPWFVVIGTAVTVAVGLALFAAGGRGAAVPSAGPVLGDVVGRRRVDADSSRDRT
jgi:SSS family solute:Na+ symporter